MHIYFKFSIEIYVYILCWCDFSMLYRTWILIKTNIYYQNIFEDSFLVKIKDINTHLSIMLVFSYSYLFLQWYLSAYLWLLFHLKTSHTDLETMTQYWSRKSNLAVLKNRKTKVEWFGIQIIQCWEIWF